MEEDHPLDFVLIKDHPTSTLSSIHLVVAVPCEFDAWMAITNAVAVVDFTLDIAELEQT
jgi:hypothetical protein